MHGTSANAPTKGLIPKRSKLASRLNAWRKRSPFNPYWIEVKWLRRASEFLAPHASGALLDVGVGERPYGELFRPYVTRYVGLEYPPVADNLHPEIWGMLERIRGVVDLFGDGQKLPFVGACFDTVMAFEVLEHVPDPDRCLAEVRRVLRPGGTLLITVPFVAPLHQLPFDYYRFTPRGLESLLQRHGFVIERMAARGNFASSTGATLSHWLLRTFGARRRQHDGSVSISRWRAPFVLPVIAFFQIAFSLAERVSSDDTSCLGYSVVARMPAPVAPLAPLASGVAGASRASSASRGLSTTSQS